MRYTLAVTSCNRFGLLQRTIDSFLRMADVLPEETIIVEDSSEPMPSFLNAPKYRALGGRSKWINTGKRRGQIAALDTLYDAVDTELVFHCEDDWEFIKRGFITESGKILNCRDIWTVSLRGDEPGYHPNIPTGILGVTQIQEPGWMGGWGGMNFNPGLRRMADYRRLHSYGMQLGYGNHGCSDELDLSRKHLEAGYRIAVLPGGPYVKHIGGGVSRAIQPLAAPPRVLLALPVTHKYEYGTHTSGIKRMADGRVAAVRATWWKDIKRFPNVRPVFFYGGATRVDPNLDEYLLDVPDDYAHLPHKVKAICQYAERHGFEYLIKGDDDTALYIDRLMRSGFDTPGVEQMGHFAHCPHQKGGAVAHCRCYVTGMCYTLSRRSIGLVANAPLLGTGDFLNWAEDYWVGGVLRQAGIRPTGHPGWVSGGLNHYVKLPLPRNTVAAHSLTPDGMREWYSGVSRGL